MEIAKNKLKVAENLSDVNTGDEADKRHAKKPNRLESSDDEISEFDYERPPRLSVTTLKKQTG